MTIAAARLLDTAFATYQAAVDALPDDQVTLDDPLWPAYSATVDLCRSLIPPTYNFPATDTDTTEHIWSAIVARNEVLTIAEVAELTDEFYDFIGLGVTNGQRLTTLPSGLSRWLAPSN